VTSAETLIARARRFRFYAQHLWRFHRPFVRRGLRRRCVRCVVSEAYSPLDAAGVCAECRARAAAPQTDAAAEVPLAAELDAVFDAAQGTGAGAHDALVMLSGGKDSAFLLHLLRQRFPRLRLLALTIDNSFMSPVALDNARRTVEVLDIDHVTLKPPKSLYAKSFRLACTLREEGKGCFETVDRIDADLGFSLGKIHATTHHIPLLVSGLSWAQVERIFGVRSFEVPPELALARVEETLGRRLDAVYEPTELPFWWDPARVDRALWPRFIHPFYAWRFEERHIQDEVVRLGLIERGNDSPMLTNNLIIPMMVVIDYLRLGYASFEPEFAAQVRAGKADPGFWRNAFEMLEYSAHTGWMLGDEIDRMAHSLGLTRAEIGAAAR
jgi:hypothetical protein